MKQKKGELSKEEKIIVADFEKGETERVVDVEKEKKRLMDLAKMGLKKSKNVNMRLSEAVLYKIRARAVENGMPYETLMASLLHKYASGQLKVDI